MQVKIMVQCDNGPTGGWQTKVEDEEQLARLFRVAQRYVVKKFDTKIVKELEEG